MLEETAEPSFLLTGFTSNQEKSLFSLKENKFFSFFISRMLFDFREDGVL